jgi:hypothetical protein
MKKEIKYTLLSLSIILIISIIIISYLTIPKLIHCNNLETEINQMLNTANHCTQDSDCGINLESSCPFGCYNLINKKIDITHIKTKMQTFTNECTKCVYGCIAAPTEEEIICKANKCIDTRFN